mmetsp:Transcript_3749/g.9092  ORF Transcript_3749/g.9092 Transcript_3749/m.9092 type:complete len:730 (+) Transcript_3749:193-2382(+)
MMRSTLTLGVVALLVCICSASVSSPDLSSLALRKMGSAVKTPATLQLRGGMQGKTSAAHSEDSTDVSRSSRHQEMFQALWDAKEKHGDGLSADALADILTTLREYPEFMYMNVKTDISSIKEYAQAKDKAQHVACFTHSLERNGANIFVLILLQHMTSLDRQAFELYTPAEGPMREDFEKLGVKVNIMKPSDPGYMVSLEEELSNFGAVFANTIMSAPVVRTAQKLGMPYTWVIHEAWPQDQFDWYASKVFMQKGIDAGIIKEAFQSAEPGSGNVCFPAKIQMELYDGLINKAACQVVYNGIPVASIDQFQKEKNRKAIRAELGYTDDDFLVLHLGTVCARKCQHVTAQAFSKLVNEKGVKNAKLLIVGARYIRQHEIDYISKVKKILKEGGVMNRATIMDIHEHVLRFYLAADVVLVPSKNEVLPLVISEAQAFRRPLVASNIDGLPEAITDGEEGFLVPPEDPQALVDAIYKLQQSDELRVAMGEKGRARVLRQFSHKAMTTTYMELIDKMAPEAPPPVAVQEPPAYTPPGVHSSLTPEPTPTEPVLVDMDMVITDWDGAFCERWLAKHPEDEQIIRGRTKFEIERNFPLEKRDEVLKVIAEPGFYSTMKPFPGALEALKEMVDEGIDVRIVSAPHPQSAGSCAREKYDWIEEHLGQAWIDRLILARDKTHVMGCMLIDDKPVVRGSSTPAWDHIVYDQPWNQHVSGKKRIMNWANWRDVVGLSAPH